MSKFRSGEGGEEGDRGRRGDGEREEEEENHHHHHHQGNIFLSPSVSCWFTEGLLCATSVL